MSQSKYKPVIGRGVGLIVIGFVSQEERAYCKVVLPESLRTLGYVTRVEKVRWSAGKGKKKRKPRPIVMLVRYLPVESLSPSNTLSDVLEQCRLKPVQESYESPLEKRMGRAVFFNEIVDDKVWAPKTSRERERALQILGLTKRACHPI